MGSSDDKLEKKSHRKSSENGDDEARKKEKKDKKRKEMNDSDEEENSSKRRKTSEKASVPVVDFDESSDMPRRRTRSMSDAEDHNRLEPSQSPEDFRKQHQITCTGLHESGSGPFKCPDPLMTFAAAPFAPPIRRALDAAGYANPTPTQAQSWPIALAGRDIITVAKTGSGKTCGFLLPAFHRLLTALEQRKRGPPGILVLAPTRELACQIEEEAVKFGRSSNIRTCCAYGGAPKSMQIRKIQAGVEVLIATPGRLNDLIEMGVVNLGHVLFFVLDEADRMLVNFNLLDTF